MSILKFSRSKNDWILTKFSQRNVKGWRKIYLIPDFLRTGPLGFVLYGANSFFQENRPTRGAKTDTHTHAWPKLEKAVFLGPPVYFQTRVHSINVISVTTFEDKATNQNDAFNGRPEE